MNKSFYVMALLLLVSCSPKEAQTDIYSFLHDITDPMIAQPDADGFIDASGVSNTDRSIYVRYRIISDIDFNPVTEISRMAAPSGFSSLLSNELEQRNSSREFIVQCQKLLARRDPIEGEAHSSVFDPIIAELQYMASLPDGHNKHLIIYSDLLENGSWLSLYRPRSNWLLMNRPERILELYRQRIPKDFKKAGNLKVHIVFVPKDHNDNRRYKQLRRIYGDLFKELGIPVSFSANLTKASMGR